MEVLSPQQYAEEFGIQNSEAVAHVLSNLRNKFPHHLRGSMPSLKALTLESFRALGAEILGVDVVRISKLDDTALRELTYGVRVTQAQLMGLAFGPNPAQHYLGVKGYQPGFWQHFDDTLFRKEPGSAIKIAPLMSQKLSPQMNQIVWGNFRANAAYMVDALASGNDEVGIQAKKSLDLFYAGNYPVGVTKDQKALVLTR